MKLCRSKTETIDQPSCDGMFAVLHARSDFCEDNVVLLEIGIAFGDLCIRSHFNGFDDSQEIINRRHLDE